MGNIENRDQKDIRPFSKWSENWQKPKRTLEDHIKWGIEWVMGSVVIRDQIIPSELGDKKTYWAFQSSGSSHNVEINQRDHPDLTPSQWLQISNYYLKYCFNDLIVMKFNWFIQTRVHR